MKKIITVLGDVLPGDLGVVMPHEHVVCDIRRESGRIDNLLDDVELCCREVALYRTAGGSTLVDVTTEDIGRDPVALKAISAKTGVHLVTTTGYYSEVIFPDYVRQVTVDQLAHHMIAEYRNGIGDTGVRPGIIGELASKQEHVTPLEERVLRAAARTHNETGLAITLHSGIGRPAPRQLAVLVSEGVSPDRVIVSHADLEWHDEMARDLDYFLPLLDQGCYLGFDTIGWEDFSPESARIERIVSLIEKGYERQLLLSSDLCRRSFYHRYGGRGYDYVLRHFVPRLREHGVHHARIDLMLRENPGAALAI